MKGRLETVDVSPAFKAKAVLKDGLLHEKGEVKLPLNVASLTVIGAFKIKMSFEMAKQFTHSGRDRYI